MVFVSPADADVDGLYGHMLPAEKCASCHNPIRRRKHRVYVRATWRESRDVLCPTCWSIICQWAQRFALDQLELGL